jgi:hypothetical protein
MNTEWEGHFSLSVPLRDLYAKPLNGFQLSLV